MSVVYYGNYLTYFEVGRVEYLRACGWPMSRVNERVHLPVVEAYVKYIRPARLDDLLEITSRVSERRRASFRFSYEIRRTPKPGFVCMLCARIIEVNDKTIVFDERFAPPVLVVAAHAAVTGWLDRVIGWVETKLDELARFASDPRSSGGMQSVDYFVLQMLNRDHGKTIIMVTHDPKAAEYATHTIHLDKGELVDAPAVAH